MRMEAKVSVAYPLLFLLFLHPGNLVHIHVRLIAIGGYIVMFQWISFQLRIHLPVTQHVNGSINGFPQTGIIRHPLAHNIVCRTVRSGRDDCRQPGKQNSPSITFKRPEKR